jgi:hypothetical protein
MAPQLVQKFQNDHRLWRCISLSLFFFGLCLPIIGTKGSWLPPVVWGWGLLIGAFGSGIFSREFFLFTAILLFHVGLIAIASMVAGWLIQCAVVIVRTRKKEKPILWPNPPASVNRMDLADQSDSSVNRVSSRRIAFCLVVASFLLVPIHSHVTCDKSASLSACSLFVVGICTALCFAQPRDTDLRFRPAKWAIAALVVNMCFTH